MSKRFYHILNYVIFLGGGIFLVWYQLRGMTPEDEKEFYNALRNANYWLLLPVVVMSLLSHLSRSMRWKLLLEPMEYNPKLKNVFAVTMAGYLANSAVPRLGEILKCTLLARYEKLKVDKLVGSILIERAFDFVCYLIFIVLTVLIQVNILGDYIGDKVSGIGKGPGLSIWMKLGIIIAAGILILFLLRYLFRRYPESKIFGRIRHFINGIGIGFKSIKNLKQRKLFIAHTIFIWLMYLLQIYIGFNAMEATTPLGIKAACSVLALATLAMIITPGGIGSFPIFVMEILILYGIATPSGKAFGWLIWGASTSIIIVVGLASLLLLPIINRKKNEVNPSYSG